MTQPTQDQAERLHDPKIECVNCLKKIMSYPCYYCGVEPYDGHEISGCCYQGRSGETLSHTNAKDIGINCNAKTTSNQDQAVEAWMESHGAERRGTTGWRIKGSGYWIPDETALFFYTICQKAERNGKAEFVESLMHRGYLSPPQKDEIVAQLTSPQDTKQEKD